MSKNMDNRHNIKTRPAWRILGLIWLSVLFASIAWLWFGWLLGLPFPSAPSEHDFIYLTASGIWFILFGCLKGMRAVHEGLHAIAAHWFGAEGISAKGTNVFVRCSSKRSWIANALFPLILPLSLYFLLVVFNWRCALTLATSRYTASIVVTVWHNQTSANKTVSDGKPRGITHASKKVVCAIPALSMPSPGSRSTMFPPRPAIHPNIIGSSHSLPLSPVLPI